MNLQERKMLDMLKELKESYCVFGIKAEFEAEGARLEEMMRLQELVVRAGIGICLKTGGAEAVHDMRRGRELGVAEIVAPMIESEFALNKYITAAHIVFTDDELEDVTLGINVESITGYQHFSAMTEQPAFDLIGALAIGRFDLSQSMGLGAEGVDSPEVLNILLDMFTMARAKNPHIHTIFGGLLNAASFPSLDGFPEGLVDGYEMRKVMFSTKLAKEKRAEGLKKASEFELAWYQNKIDVHLRITQEDERYMSRLKANL